MKPRTQDPKTGLSTSGRVPGRARAGTQARPRHARAAIRPATARERIEQASYELFSRIGVQAVGVDEVVARSGVAKMTLYRHYPSKTHLALAFLRRREELWTRAWLQAEVDRRATNPAARLLAIFDVFNRWFRRADFEGCSFINVLLETPESTHPVRAAAVNHLSTIRVFLAQLAGAAGVADPDDFARRWHILMKGSIVAAAEGDRNAARRAQQMGRLLLAAEHIAVPAAIGARQSSAGGTRHGPRRRSRGGTRRS